MKTPLLPLLTLAALLPAAASAAANELARCEQIFRDNMDIMVFTMPCSADEAARAVPQDKLAAHLREVSRCEALVAGKYATQKEAVQKRLNAYVAPHAEAARRAGNSPQQTAAYCAKQNAAARQKLRQY